MSSAIEKNRICSNPIPSASMTAILNQVIKISFNAAIIELKIKTTCYVFINYMWVRFFPLGSHPLPFPVNRSTKEGFSTQGTHRRTDAGGRKEGGRSRRQSAAFPAKTSLIQKREDWEDAGIASGRPLDVNSYTISRQSIRAN